MKAGLLRIVAGDALTRLCTDPDDCPAPIVDAPAGAQAAPVAGPEGPDRALTSTDRLLLFGDQRAGPFTKHVLGIGADVWLLPTLDSARALALVDALGVTLCRPSDEQLATIACVNAEGQRLPAGRTGWLVGDSAGVDSAINVGYIDSGGWVHVLGSANNALKVTDGVLSPFEGARRLEAHPRVRRACLLALSGEQSVSIGVERGFFAVAEIAGLPSPVLEVELLDHVKRGVSASKCPVGIALVSELPVRNNGAPDDAALRQIVQSELGPCGGTG